ncbi:hypothetical protein D3C78_987050 [compost metagenome]
MTLSNELFKAQLALDAWVVGAQQADIALAHQYLTTGARHRRAADGGVNLAASQPLTDLVYLQRQHLDFGVRRFAVQAREDERQETHFTQVREGNAKPALGGTRVENTGALHRTFDAGQRVAQCGVQLVGDKGGLDTVAGATEQRVAKQLTQPRQAVADRGLGDEQALGSQGHAAGFVEGDEGADQVQVDMAHGASKCTQ